MGGGRRLGAAPIAALAVAAACLPSVAAAQSPTDAQYAPPFLNMIESPPKPKPEPKPPPEPPPPPVFEEPEAPATEPNPERSGFAERLPTVTDIDLTSERAAEGGMLTLLLIALLYLPVMIFNKTTERNHEAISGWLASPFGRFAFVFAWLPWGVHPLALLLATGIVSGFLFSFIEPGFPTEEGSLLYLTGMVLGFSFVALVFFATWQAVVRRLEPESQGHWTLYPPYILLAGFLVVMARLAHFLPGIVLGTLAEYEPGRQLSTRTAGLRVFVTYLALLAVGAAAWFAWIPVAEAAAEEGASAWIMIADAALAVTFVTGLESVVFGLIPLRFLDGDELYAWNKGLWLGLWGLGLFWFAEVIVHPALSTYNEASETGAIWFGVMFGALMVVAVGTWLFFRIREVRLGPSPEELDPY
jgi:MFS family permease